MEMLVNNATEEETSLAEATPLYPLGASEDDEVVAWQTFECAIWDASDVETVTMYRVGDRTWYPDDIAEAEQHLTDMFWETFLGDNDPEVRELFKRDKPALRETFNNWTDSLHKDGEMCDDAASNLCLASEEVPA